MLPGKPLTSRSVTLAAGAIVALLIGWRIIAIRGEALLGSIDRVDPVLAQIAGEPRAANTPPDEAWRRAIVGAPTDAKLFVGLGETLDAAGRTGEAEAAFEEAMRLDRTHPTVSLATARFHSRHGQHERALRILADRLRFDPDLHVEVVPMFVSMLGEGHGTAFFLAAARSRPGWYERFFEGACAGATATSALVRLFEASLQAGVAGRSEQRCLIARLQRERSWSEAQRLWRASLAPEQQADHAGLFNGGFEWPISNIGFDWITPNQEGQLATADTADMTSGKRALHVRYANARYGVPPIHQYLLLRPGGYLFSGSGRADGLDSWLGLQWGLYCLPEGDTPPRQLMHSRAFNGTFAWTSFRQHFDVPGQCPVQILRLELANPRRDANTPGDVVARVRGSVWFDDLDISRRD